ncbi:S-layer homology domain-containing protein [Anaerotignum lactatifermentans]|uniref:S-layer homology domain-containing protein n=1 Tax=Anaerotignum lactatifermentans TaxID=160404 RepID=UPI002670F0D6|nr:S-layer homology domain-containing protein [Anaerotignum lactatifermentans]
MRKRIFAAFVCLCMLMALVPSMAYANDTVYTGGLCEHHTQHDSACGYSEGTAEVPCNHEHTEDCYTLVTNCVHEHTAECYSEGSTEPDLCGHVCSEESGCITKELNCNHEHDESCGYVPATAGTPCTYECEICNAQAAEEPECICETKCTEEESNADCPVCGGENGDISGCVGAAMMLAPMGARAITATPPNGEGTKEKPYQIETAGELYWFAEQVNSGNTAIHAKLMDNITINDNVLDENGSLNEEKSDTFEQWTPIGEDNDHEYTGTFDGQNHTISGLYVVSTGDYAGLFGNVNSGTIKNVGVKDSYISGSGRYVGGVCGQNYYCTIENCYNKGTVIGTGSNAAIGGVCGENNSIIENSYNTGKVSGNIAGGVCGGSTGMIESCYNTGKVSGNTAGGVCGVATCRIKNCCNKGTVTGTGNVGGVCGQNDSIYPIENSYNTGTVNGTNAGGVSGYNNFGTITNCYFLSGTAGNGIGTSSGTVTNVEEKDNRAFSFGEVAWLLNEGQEPKPWGQGTNNPLLHENHPKDATCETPVRVTIQMPNGAAYQYIYTTAGSVLPMSAYPEGYAFYGEQNYQSLINIGEKTYNNDTAIYAKNADETTGITLNPTTLSLYVNDTETLTATVAPVTASQVLKWESSNLSVATVDQNGKVTAVGKGTATITASAHDISSVKATCTVTVKKKSSGGGSVFFWDLKFDTNGGSKIDTVTEWEYSTIDLDEYVPEKEGYKFVGWYADKDFDKKIDEVYLTQDTTVYAKWEKIAEEVPEKPEEVEETEETETISFKDVKESDWFYDAVSYAVENGLMSGMSKDIFAPNTPLTREMLAVVLYNVEGQPGSTEADTFTDVKGNMWYTDAILWANENGIVAGYDNGAYGVGDLITREQFATILYRYAQFKGYDTTQGGMAVREFSDYENISDYARPAMAWAVNAGIMGGMDDGTLMPQGKATRAEAATMLMNFCENVMK